jgi:methionine synthase II (cobalamin-independent)
MSATAEAAIAPRTRPPFRADHVGSLLRPHRLRDARRLAAAGSLDAAALRRVEDAAKYLPLEQLALSPQCGFASTEEGNTLTEEEQWAKLRLCIEVAEDVWGGV